MLLPSRILRDVSATGCAHVMLIYDEPLLSQPPLSGHFPVNCNLSCHNSILRLCILFLNTRVHCLMKSGTLF